MSRDASGARTAQSQSAPPAELVEDGERVSRVLDEFEQLLLDQLSRRSTYDLRNTELPRVLGELLGRTTDISRLRPVKISPWAESELLSLKDVEKRHLDKVSPAYAIYNRLRRVVVEFASPEYMAVAHAGEMLRKDDDGRPLPWPPAAEKVRASLVGREPTAGRQLDEGQLLKEIKLFYDREYESNILHSQARRRARARVLLGLVPLLLVLVGGFALALRSAEVLIGKEIIVAVVAGAVGATLSGTFKVRDRLRTLSEIRSFGAQMMIQPSVGAALALFVAVALDQGLAGVTLPAGANARAAAFAVFGFLAGFSEPFALGIAQKLGEVDLAKPTKSKGP